MLERNEALDCPVYAPAAALRFDYDRPQVKHRIEWERRAAPPAKNQNKQQAQRTSQVRPAHPGPIQDRDLNERVTTWGAGGPIPRRLRQVMSHPQRNNDNPG